MANNNTVSITLQADVAKFQADMAASGKAAEQAMKQMADKVGASSKTMADQVGMSSKQMAFALRGVPAQFTDIFTSLQGGQNPMTVFIQQGGQLKDMFGGVGPAAKAMGGYIAGLINPYTLTAGAAAGLAIAYSKGAAEAEAYNKALIMTGNYAGTTAQQMAAMAKSISSATGGTVGAAAEALAALAATGDVSATQFPKMAAATVAWSKATGESVVDIAKQFSKLQDEPLKATLALNDSQHYLTRTIYDQIKALEDQGRMLDAGVLAQTAWADAINQRAPLLVENLGIVEQAWRGITGSAKSAWDAMLNVGRVSDPVANIRDSIASLQAKMLERKSGAGYDPAGFSAQLRIDNAQLATLQEKLVIAAKGSGYEALSAQYQLEEARATEAKVAWDKEADKYLSKKVLMQREIAAAQSKYTQQKPADQNPAGYAAAILGIQDKFKEPVHKTPANLDPQQMAKAQMAYDLAVIKANAQSVSDTFSNSSKVMEMMRSANLVGDGEYYAKKRAELEANSAIQEAALAADITRLEKEKLIGKDRIQIETKLVEARAALASAKASNATSGVLLGLREGGDNKAQDDFFTKSTAASDARALAMVESIRVSQLSALDAEQEAYAARIKALESFNALRQEGEAAVNAMIEEESTRHAQRKVDLQTQTDMNMVALMAGSADQMYSMLKQAGMEQTALGKVAFLASKALAVAQIILSTNVAAAAAMTLPPIGLGPIAGAPYSMAIKAMGYASAGMVAGLAIAEASAEGGYDIPGGKNPITQLHEREMVLPKQQADVIRGLAANGGAGGGAMKLTIVNNGTPQRVVEERSISATERVILMEDASDLAVQKINASISNTNGNTGRLIRDSFGLQRRRL